MPIAASLFGAIIMITAMQLIRIVCQHPMQPCDLACGHTMVVCLDTLHPCNPSPGHTMVVCTKSKMLRNESVRRPIVTGIIRNICVFGMNVCR